MEKIIMDRKKIIIAVVVILLVAIGVFAYISANSHDTWNAIFVNRKPRKAH